jgi:serine/threonine-protein kinase
MKITLRTINIQLIIRIIKLLSLFIALSALSGYITFKILSSGLTIEIPDLTGRPVSEAKGILESKGLSLIIESEAYDLDVPEGHVLTQDMTPGSNVKGEANVNVVVSKGPEVRLIPSVTGKSMKEAKKIFRDKKLSIGKIIKVHSDEVEKDTIIAQRPAPEEWTGEDITVIASAGPYNVIYYCPFFQGMLKEDALYLAAELGVNVTLRESPSGSRIVIGQEPQPGAEIKMGDTLQLTLGG